MWVYDIEYLKDPKLTLWKKTNFQDLLQQVYLEGDDKNYLDYEEKIVTFSVILMII